MTQNSKSFFFVLVLITSTTQAHGCRYNPLIHFYTSILTTGIAISSGLYALSCSDEIETLPHTNEYDEHRKNLIKKYNSANILTRAGAMGAIASLVVFSYVNITPNYIAKH